MKMSRGATVSRTPDEIAVMRRAGRVVAEMHECIRAASRPGVSTLELDAVGREVLERRGARSNFLGYHGFPAVICASPHHLIVHGIPDHYRLRDGDLISIDCGAIVDGWHGDAAITVPVGAVLPELAELIRVTEEAMWRGIAAARLGGRVTDISHAVESHVRAQGSYGILEDDVGHGIGSAMHQPPNVPNYRRAGRGPKLVRGLALAVEPMVTLGSKHTDVLDDDWTIITADGSMSAHFEHSFTLTPNGAWILTAIDGGEQRLGELGVPFGGA